MMKSHFQTGFSVVFGCLLLAVSLMAAACQKAKESEAAPAAAPAVEDDAPAAAAETQPNAELVLVPGKSLGPISLDMEEKDLRALGLEVTEKAPGFLDVGPYRVVLKDGRVESISVGFFRNTKSVAIGDKKFDRTMRLETAASIMGDCAAPKHNIGASIVECLGGTISFLRGGTTETITSVELKRAE